MLCVCSVQVTFDLQSVPLRGNRVKIVSVQIYKIMNL